MVRVSKHKDQYGFSLIELVVTIVIVAIIFAGLAVLWPGRSINLDDITAKMVADIRYARILAISQKESYQIVFNTGQNSNYQLRDISGSSINFPDQNSNVVTLDPEILMALTNLGNNRIVFNATGKPEIDTNGTALTNIASISLTWETQQTETEIYPRSGTIVRAESQNIPIDPQPSPTPSIVPTPTPTATPTPSPSPDTTPPTVPILSLVNTTDTSISVSWTASTDNVTASNYIIYNVYLDNVLVTTTLNTNYTFSGLDQNTSYAIEVSATDEANNTSARDFLNASTDSTTFNCSFSFGNDSVTDQYFGINPLIINNLSNDNINGWTIVVTMPSDLGMTFQGGWNANFNVNSNVITIANQYGWNKQINAGGQLNSVGFNLSFSNTAYTTPNQIELASTVTLNGENCGSTLNPTPTPSPTPDTEAPTTPVVSLVGTTDSSISVSWPASTDNVTDSNDIIYNVYLDNNSLGTTTNTNYTFNGLNQNTTYTIEVSATDEANNTSDKGQLTATTNNPLAYCSYSFGNDDVSDKYLGINPLILVNNSGSTINGWTINITMPADLGMTFQGGWNANFNVVGNNITITNQYGWNKQISPGGQLSSVGFNLSFTNGAYTTVSQIEAYSIVILNGQACSRQ